MTAHRSPRPLLGRFITLRFGLWWNLKKRKLIREWGYYRRRRA